MTARHRACGLDELKAIANPAAHEPGPRVIFVLCLTVAKVDPYGIRRAQVNPVRSRKIIKCQQPIDITGDLRNRLGELGPIAGPSEADAVRGHFWPLTKVDLGFRDRSPVDWAGVRLEEAGLHRAGWSRLFRCQLQQPRVLRRQLRC